VTQVITKSHILLAYMSLSSDCRPAACKVPEVKKDVPLPGSVQGQVGRGFEQPGLMEGVPTHGRGVGMRLSIRSLPTQTIPWFYDEKALKNE